MIQFELCNNKILCKVREREMKKYRVYAIVTGTKHIGEFQAKSREEAEQIAWDSDNGYVSICWHCSKEIDEPTIEKMVVEEVE